MELRHLLYIKTEVDGIFARLEESKGIVRQMHKSESGELKIGYISSVYQSHLADVLIAMRTVFPYIKTNLFEMPTLPAPLMKSKFKQQYKLAAYLKSSPFIFFSKDFAPRYNDKLIEICARMGFKPDIVHEANNAHSILQLIEAGLGVSILPYSLKQQYSYLKVSFIELENIPVNTEVVLAYKQNNKSAALNWFIEHYHRGK